MELADLKNKEIHLVGIFGAEGSSLALFLIKLGCKKLSGHDFSKKSASLKIYHKFHPGLPDKNINQQFKKIHNGLKQIYYQQHYLRNINQANLIFVPSSWLRYPINRPLIKISSQKTFWHWYNLILEFYPGKIIGVTGTAGKGTTVNLIKLILMAAKKRVMLAGDSWQSVDFNKILKLPKDSYLVAEISNRALTFAKFSKKSPAIAVITNITKNHLDDHQGSFKNYIETKKEIARYQKKDDYLILNNENLQTKKIGNFGKAKKLFYQTNVSDLKLIKNKNIIGSHLVSDCLAAIKVAKILKISTKNIRSGLKYFKAREGRMQLIKIVNNISFINDAASTRPEATIGAIKSFPKNSLNLILEGSRYRPDKKQFISLIKAIKEQKIKNIVFSGKISLFLNPLFKKYSVKAQLTKNLNQSFQIISKRARPGEIVLFSPSCESFGEFKDYRERLHKFNALVERFSHGQ